MKKALLIGLMMPVLVCCTGPKELSYLQNLGADEVLSQSAVEEYQLRAGDQLTVRVSSFDYSAVAPFNIQNAEGGDIPYIIDEKGFMRLPALGAIEAEGKSLAALEAILQTQFAQLAKGAVVRVELVGASVSVLGEVNRPVRVHWPCKGLTLMEALTDAGDLRANASRVVMVLRREGNETRTLRVDLRDKSCLMSPAWRLLPGDVVYVQPRRGRRTY